MNRFQKQRSFQEFLDEKIHAFVIETVQFTDEMRKFQKLRPFIDQLIRSSTSGGANVHEARGCTSRKEYARFFEHAAKSAHETTYWLFLVTKLEAKLN